MNDVIIQYPYGTWVKKEDDICEFLDNVGNVVYRTKDLIIMGNNGFIIPFNISDHDYSTNSATIEYGQMGNGSIIHYKKDVMLLTSTRFDEIKYSDRDFLVYPIDNRLSYGIAVYDETSGSLKKGFYSADWIDILSDTQLISKKNDVYYYHEVRKNFTREGIPVHEINFEPIGMVPFKLGEDTNTLVTLTGEFIKNVNNK